MNTKALVTMTASIIAANAVLAADWTVSENTVLTADRTVDALTVEDGVTLDLNRYSLTCTSLAGTGTITSPSGDLTSPQGRVTGTYLVDGVDTSLTGGSYAALFDDDFTNYGNPHRLLSGTLANGNFLTVMYDFGEDAEAVVNKFKIYNGSNDSSRNPYVWKFEGSNDKESGWITLQSVGSYTPKESGAWSYTGSVEEAWKGDTGVKTSVEYSFENETPYRYYRFVFIKTNAKYCELKQLEFFNTNPGELHVNVADGEMENSTVAISGNVKVVKEGLGTFIPSKTGQTYTGGTEIVAGTVKAVTIGCLSGGYAFGPAGSKIIVSTNATSVGAFDVNGQARYGGYDFVLNGGTVKNTSELNINSGKLIDVSLLADSMFDFAQGTCGFYDPASTGETTLDLAGHTLTLFGAGGTQVEHLTVTSQGKILVADGFVNFYGRNKHCPTNDLRAAVLETGTSGQVIVQNEGTGIEVKLGDYICNTAATDTGHYSVAYGYTPKVYGTFKPNTDYFHGVELQDGATIDLSGRTTALPLRGLQYPSIAATATSLHTVTFAAPEEPAESITIYVKLGERDAHGKLISWDSIPSGVNFVSASGEKKRSFLVTDRGLSLPNGLMIIFQ